MFTQGWAQAEPNSDSAIGVGVLRGNTTRPGLLIPLIAAPETRSLNVSMFVGINAQSTSFSNLFRDRGLYTGAVLGYSFNLGRKDLSLNALVGYTANVSAFTRSGRWSDGEWGYGLGLQKRF